MTYTYKLARRLAILRDLAMLSTLALVIACTSDSTGPESTGTSAIALPVSFRVVPGAATVETNQPIRFRGEKYDDQSFALPLTWEASGGSITDDGTFMASRPGTYKVVGRGRRRQKADTSTVVVVPPAPDLTEVEVSPDPTTVSAGAQHTFTAVGRLSDGTTAAIGVNWSATGGIIDAGGVYKAGATTGTYRVVAANTGGTLADTATVTIAAVEQPPPPAPTLTEVVIKPASASLVIGAERRFSAYGRSSAGDSVAVSVTFSATGGTISNTGLYIAGGTAGSFRVIASSSGLADTAVVSVTASSPSTSGPVGVPFGPYNALASGASAFGPPFTLAMDAYSSSNIVTRISTARSDGYHLHFSMTGGSSTQYVTNGKFDYAKWKQKMDTYNTATIRQAVGQGVADGTIVGNSVMDEPSNPKWGGVMTKELVDQMCGYVKGMFPTLPVGVVHDHDKFESTKSYRVCDYIVSQYRQAKGDVATFRDAGLALAQRDGHAIAFSINILDGGTPDRDGTWDCAGTGGKGTYSPTCRMTAQQVRDFGLVLGPAGCAMFTWRWDDAFMTDPENVRAFRDVAATLANAPRRACRRS